MAPISRGLEVVISVGTFIARLEQLPTSGVEGAEQALAILREGSRKEDIDAAKADPAVRAVILTSAFDKAFSAGMDLEMIRGGNGRW